MNKSLLLLTLILQGSLFAANERALEDHIDKAEETFENDTTDYGLVKLETARTEPIKQSIEETLMNYVDIALSVAGTVHDNLPTQDQMYNLMTRLAQYGFNDLRDVCNPLDLLRQMRAQQLRAQKEQQEESTDTVNANDE